jgi:hypothetical protein
MELGSVRARKKGLRFRTSNGKLRPFYRTIICRTARAFSSPRTGADWIIWILVGSVRNDKFFFIVHQQLAFIVPKKKPTPSTTMKICALAVASVIVSASAFTGVPLVSRVASKSSLSMVLEKPKIDKKISKLEQLKVDSHNLADPLKEVRNKPWDLLLAGSLA